MLTIENYKKIVGMEVIGYSKVGGMYDRSQTYQIWLMDGGQNKQSTLITLNRTPMIVNNELYCMWTGFNGVRSEVYLSKNELRDIDLVCKYIQILLDKR